MQGFDAYTGEGVSGKYEILGDDMQILTVNLKDGELLTTEPGTMSFMSNDIKVTEKSDQPHFTPGSSWHPFVLFPLFLNSRA